MHKKKFCSLLLAIVLVFSIVMSTNVRAATQIGTVQSRLEEISGQSGYKPGTVKQANFCWYFVSYVSQKLFGVSIPNKPSGYQLAGINENSNWALVNAVSGSSATNSAVKNVLKQACAGDIIQYRNSVTSQHTAMIYAVDSNGISIYDSAKCYKEDSGQQVRIYTCSWNDIFSWNWERGLGSFDGATTPGLSLYRCNKGASVIQGNGSGPDKSGPNSGPNISVNTTAADTITETSAILRGSFTITGARASECGMYLGTDPNNLTKLGSDTVNTSGTSMFYSTAKYGRTLEPGTTYYYQGYAKVGNNIYWGQKKSFQAKGEQPIKPSISLTPQTVTIKDDREPLQLTVTTKPVGTAVTWSSSDKTVVYVYKETGKIVGLASGTAVVTAEMNYDGKRYQALCQVTVLPSVENPKVSLSDQNITIATDAYKVLSVTSSPNGEPISWMSSNPSVATVDESGRIYGVSAGNAVITATMRYNGASYSATCNVTVESPVEELIPPVLTLSSNRINEGEYVTAKWTAFSRNASYYIDYSGQINNGDVDFGMSGNTKALSMNFGANLKAGTYTVSLVASDSAGNARSNSVMLTVVPKGTTAVVVNTNGQYLAINDRPAASPNYSNQIGRIPPAGVVKVDLNKTSGNWYWVEYGGVSGYAYSKYLSLQ